LQNIIKRQRQAIEKIRKENERLKEQLKAESQQNAAATEGNTVSVISGDPSPEMILTVLPSVPARV
jgi:cell shape-determining protein MreC